MRTSLILAVCCAVVLLGAYFASRLLVNDVPPTVVVAPPVGPVVSVPLLQRLDPPAAVEPGTRRMQQEAAMLAPRQGMLQPVNSPRLVETTSQPNAEVAPSPFQGDSKELEYTETLLADPRADLERVRSAREVLSRCIEQEPDNKRCLEGLALAKARIGAREATQLKPATPTLLAPPEARPSPR